jgi:nucleotide-binding universal stress UspA family protein
MAESECVDLIVMSSHGRGGPERADRVPVGSVAEGVLKGAPCPVFVVPVHLEEPIISNVVKETSPACSP